MITYEYQCPACGADQAVKHSIKDEPQVACPQCGQPMKRSLSGGDSFQVKGGTVRSHVQQKQARKASEDMNHAEKVARQIKDTYQPKLREAAEKRLDATKPPKDE